MFIISILLPCIMYIQLQLPVFSLFPFISFNLYVTDLMVARLHLSFVNDEYTIPV